MDIVVNVTQDGRTVSNCHFLWDSKDTREQAVRDIGTWFESLVEKGTVKEE